MSTIIMSQCWPLQMSATQKAVLISLADNANDEGVCWPSIAKICMRTCLSERAVQNAIKWLASAKIVTVNERTGRSSYFTITPAAYAPPQEVRPAAGAPRTVKEPQQEPTKEPKKSAAAQLDLSGFPEQPSPAVWADFLKHRKAKRAPLTQTAVNLLAKELSLAAGSGWSVDDALAEAMAAGWQSLKAAWLANRRAPPSRHHGLDQRDYGDGSDQTVLVGGL
ncbi:primosomal protein I [Pseudomonas phage Itty13]|uniref:Primosomal protein I n=1 Tax=Pseudomonas phage Itty13 TaxID=2805750 RepID=A0A889IQR2_9CAUD|nr:replication initiation protein [Pseudomonas phage Itty13]QRE00631.1 primosomal protein I [Pseudomonas phage Itty13]